MKIAAKDGNEYVAKLPAERQPHIETLRKLVKSEVPAATEGIQWGMLGYAIEGRPFAALASQKQYLSLYLMDLYTQPALRKQHEKALAPLKMGRSCINFASVDELPLDAIAAILRAAPGVVVKAGTLAAKEPAAKKPPAKKPAAKKRAVRSRA